MANAAALFQALTPLGFVVGVTTVRWNLIVTAKHPVMAGHENLVRAALEAPDEVRQSRIDSRVLLFYKARGTKAGRAGGGGGRGKDVFHHCLSGRTGSKKASKFGGREILHDREGQTLTVWFTDPSLEHVAEETGEEVVLMKDRSGRVIGFEKLNFSVAESDSVHVAFEAATT